MHALTRLAIVAATTALLGGCAQYWVRPNTDLRTTATDLEACRLQGSRAGVAFSGTQLETPCMVAKGYSLSNTPPQ